MNINQQAITKAQNGERLSLMKHYIYTNTLIF